MLLGCCYCPADERDAQFSGLVAASARVIGSSTAVAQVSSNCGGECKRTHTSYTAQQYTYSCTRHKFANERACEGIVQAGRRGKTRVSSEEFRLPWGPPWLQAPACLLPYTFTSRPHLSPKGVCQPAIGENNTRNINCL